ncbi:glycine cleavage system protein GcvH [Desulfonatronovibrio hydrogenovorans]|uniref:glycine cleavage system protein GcvH n=1 Tax=Desulfonatronovibrio hydrogenovorans TaxID=53245 RepID=UPI000490F92F|nr:glycine cleavage system protein GcvH [Desulfonatronovibrio hydrogenovorans]
MIPSELLYSRSHEWVKVQDQTALTGITFFAQEQLGDITFVELPQPGTDLEKGQEMGVVESVKAASEIYAPVSGQVVEVNHELENSPELINQDPYGRGWLVKIKVLGPVTGLISPEEYAGLVEGD